MLNRFSKTSFVLLFLLLTINQSSLLAKPVEATQIKPDAPPVGNISPNSALLGSYICTFAENGVLNLLYHFSLAKNGRFVDHLTREEANWHYSASNALAFPAIPNIINATYLPKQDKLVLLLREAPQHTHDAPSDLLDNLYDKGHTEQDRALTCEKFAEDVLASNKRQAQFAQPQPLTTSEVTERVAFSTDRDGGNSEIYRINPDGSDLTRLTNNTATDGSPSWSPDGTELVFTSDRDGSFIDIYKMDANGSNVVRLTTSSGHDIEPSWSTNGEKIAFASNRDGDYEIFVMDADGNNQTPLTTNTTDDTYPTWSPAGRHIAFVSRRDGNHEIYLMDADGSNQTNLTNHSSIDWMPAFSPTGQHIAFVSNRNGNSSIYTIDTSGGSLSQLTFSNTLWAPAWSPDGSQLVYMSDQNGNDELYTMDANGANQTRLTTDGGFENMPDWTAQDVYIQRVLHIVYDPYLPVRDQNLTSYFYDPLAMSNEVPISFKEHSSNRVKFVIQDEIIVDAFPPRSDGFMFTETTFFDCKDSGWPNTSQCNGQITADYSAIITDPAYDICGRLNRGEIDEVWLNTPPNTGFFESVLAGPSGFAYNGPTYTANSCNGLVPIMMYNYSRLWEGGHTFGHRMEATMERVYGRWEQNTPNPNNWEKFGMVRWQSPDFDYAGCGSIHFTPNATMEDDDYDYGSMTIPFDSICDDFNNYPNLGDPQQVKTSVTCTAWDCSTEGYYYWWFSHLPHLPGFGPDGKFQDWWIYFLDPNFAQASPLADMSINGQFGSATRDVDLTNTSIGTYNTIAWDFGDGSSSTTTNPTHAFVGDGNFAVNLTISGAFGTDTATYYVSTMPAPAYEGLKGRYYDYSGIVPPTDPFNDGIFQFERIDSNVDFHWGNSSPDPAQLGNDDFVIQWQGWVRAPFTGSYTFRLHSDDGSRLQIGDEIDEDWRVYGDNNTYMTLDLEAGEWYPLVIDYFEVGGIAQIQLEWQPLEQSGFTAVPAVHLAYQQAAVSGVWGTYYDYVGPFHVVPEDPFGNGTIQYEQLDPNIDFHWGEGSPNEPFLGTQLFAIQWDGWIRSPIAGNVEFRVHSDDGTLLKVGSAANEEWIICGDCNNYLTVNMEANEWVPLHLSYFENVGVAQVQLEWKLPGGTTFTAVPQAHFLAGTEHCSLPVGPGVEADITGNVVDLTLTNNNGHDRFYIYAMSEPYASPFMYDAKLTAVSFSDDIGTANSYYYYSTEANGAVCESAPSNRVGVFRFGITPGE